MLRNKTIRGEEKTAEKKVELKRASEMKITRNIITGQNEPYINISFSCMHSRVKESLSYKYATSKRIVKLIDRQIKRNY